MTRRLNAALTPQEERTWELIATGMESKMIAHEMGISPFTLATYIKRLFTKCSVDGKHMTNRTQLALHWHGLPWRDK